jgi:hypothetical protein
MKERRKTAALEERPVMQDLRSASLEAKTEEAEDHCTGLASFTGLKEHPLHDLMSALLEASQSEV